MILKFIILQTLFIAKTVYGIENIKVDKKKHERIKRINNRRL